MKYNSVYSNKESFASCTDLFPPLSNDYVLSIFITTIIAREFLYKFHDWAKFIARQNYYESIEEVLITFVDNLYVINLVK